jgi:hypothetical protein
LEKKRNRNVVDKVFTVHQSLPVDLKSA